MRNYFLIAYVFWLLLPSLLPAGDAASSAELETLKPRVYTLRPGPGVQHELQGLLIQAVPGDTFELQAGTYKFDMELIVTTTNITIRGAGPDKTILSFKRQHAGSKGLEATGDNFVIEDLAIEDSPGNALKVLGARGVTCRRVRTEWTGGPKSTNGAYGLYPVQCENVLIDECVSIGASDAGIYVGQSKNIVVRNCRAEFNVAGIEIENSIDADVYANTATHNTGGILVFDLPGLDVRNGRNVRVFRNRVIANNHPNFAPEGNIVGTVPPGTGVMVMATDHVEVFDNEIRDHNTTNVSLVSYLIAARKFDRKTYDPISQSVSVHDNKISGGGKQPGGPIAPFLLPILGTTFPDILYDGVVDGQKLVDGKIPEEMRLHLDNNGEATFANVRLPDMTPQNIVKGKVKADRDVSLYAGRLKPLPPVELKPHAAPAPAADSASLVYRRAPSKLSEYRLFKNTGFPHEPADGVVPYDLTTPLFSDYTGKHRFIRVAPGDAVDYDPQEVFQFPVGTVIAKTFTSPTDHGRSVRKERALETRILEHKPTGWYGYTYVWNDEQTDAFLSLGGGTTDVGWTDAAGKKQKTNYIIPHANQCKSCHVTGSSFKPIGPKARYLNRDFAYAHGTENQLAYLSRVGLLRGAPVPEKAPRAPAFDDPSTGSVEQRARAWLDINCAHCHSPEGPARTSGLDLQISQSDPAKIGVWKSPVAAGRGSGGRKYDIVPGEPDKSILLYRLESTEPGVMMPELPRRMVHAEGVKLIREWVRQMQDQKNSSDGEGRHPPGP